MIKLINRYIAKKRAKQKAFELIELIDGTPKHRLLNSVSYWGIRFDNNPQDFRVFHEMVHQVTRESQGTYRHRRIQQTNEVFWSLSEKAFNDKLGS